MHVVMCVHIKIHTSSADQVVLKFNGVEEVINLFYKESVVIGIFNIYCTKFFNIMEDI